VERGPSEILQLPLELQERGRQQIINTTAANIEVLTGASKLDDARMLTEKLFAFEGSDATRQMVQRHVDRANALKR
jgi:hypothetical protein